MAKLIVVNHVTLDGVMQAPARPDEDTRDGFAHGGWAVAGHNELLTAKISERIGGRAAFLFGRRTYEDFQRVWTQRADSPFSAALTRTPKYVASRDPGYALSWESSSLLRGDVTDAVATLKRELPGALVTFGSGDLIRTLLPNGLIDEYVLQVHPVVLGTGRRLFPPGARVDLRLVESVPTPTGVLIAIYERPE